MTSASRPMAVASAHSALVGDRDSDELSGALASEAWRPRLGSGGVGIVVEAALAPLDVAADPACRGDPARPPRRLRCDPSLPRRKPESSHRNQHRPPSGSAAARCCPWWPSWSTQLCTSATSFPANQVLTDRRSGSWRVTVARHRSTSTALTAIPVDHAREAPQVVHKHLPSFGLRQPNARRRARRCCRPVPCFEMPEGSLSTALVSGAATSLRRFVQASRPS
jgi:hypothetical protein